jgi:hypothetical protein
MLNKKIVVLTGNNNFGSFYLIKVLARIRNNSTIMSTTRSLVIL